MSLGAAALVSGLDGADALLAIDVGVDLNTCFPRCYAIAVSAEQEQMGERGSVYPYMYNLAFSYLRVSYSVHDSQG